MSVRVLWTYKSCRSGEFAFGLLSVNLKMSRFFCLPKQWLPVGPIAFPILPGTFASHAVTLLDSDQTENTY